MLGLHQKTVQKLARSGDIPAIQIGRYWRFRASSLQKWLDVKFSGQPLNEGDSLKPRERYQQGSIRPEARKHGDVWTLRWRENDVHKREIIGTVKEFPSKALALKACVFLRSTIKQEIQSATQVW